MFSLVVFVFSIFFEDDRDYFDMCNGIYWVWGKIIRYVYLNLYVLFVG